MGERKVLNKYYPPDFDPAKLPKGKRARDEQMKVRMMLPMSVRCNTCGNFMYKGTKFNTRMENVETENYLGIKVFRFYWRCTGCAAEFTIKTDPKNSDYSMEHGATRNYEPWREKEVVAAQTVQQREEEERGNAMKALENRTLDSKREMDIVQALDEQRSLNARHEQVTPEQALAALKRTAEGQESTDLDPDDEEAVKRLLAQQAGFVRRIPSDSSKRSRPDPAPSSSMQPTPQADPQPASAASQSEQVPRPAQPAPASRLKPAVVIKRKPAAAPPSIPAKTIVSADMSMAAAGQKEPAGLQDQQPAPNGTSAVIAQPSPPVTVSANGQKGAASPGGLLSLGQYSSTESD